MRILHVIETLGRGGAEQALVNLLPALGHRGLFCEVAVLWPSFGMQKQPMLEARGIRVHSLGGRYERRWNLPAVSQRLARLCRRRGYDVLHAHLIFADACVGLSRTILPAPRRVATLHNTDFDIFVEGSLTAQIGRIFLPSIFVRTFDGCSAVSGPVAAHYRQHIPGLNVTVIPNAFPVPELPPRAERRPVLEAMNVDHENFVITVVARLALEKGHDVLIDALVALRKEQLRPMVLLFGEGPLRESLQKRVAKLDLTAQVRFFGNIPHEQLMPIVAHCDAFVLPSLHEGFGMAPAEAMLFERAVLTTTAGGLTDVVEDQVSGLTVPPGDAIALADGIAQLMTDAALRQRLGHAARQQIIGKFGAPMIAARWEDFYHSLQ